MLHRPCLAVVAAVLVLVAPQTVTVRGALAQTGPGPATAGTLGGPPSAPTPDAGVAPSAAPADPYTVSGVGVDVTAGSAAEARDKAILEAQRKAFATLFRRLANDGGNRTPPNVSDTDLQRMIQSFGVDQERGSAVRYVGSLTFKFHRAAVRSYLERQGTRVVEPAAARPKVAAPSTTMAATTAVAASTAPPPPAAPPVGAAPVNPVVVVPVYQVAGRAELWEERTPWRATWEDFAATSGANQVQVPPGELTDIADIGVNDALQGNPAALARLAAHYATDTVVVATLTVGDRLDPATGAQITVSRFSANGQPWGGPESITLASAGGEAAEAFLGRALTATFESLSKAPPAAAPVAAPVVVPESRFAIGIPITGLRDWLGIRQRLAVDALITGIDLITLNATRVEVVLHFKGDAEALRTALDRDNFTLTQFLPTTGAVPAASSWELTDKAATAPAAAYTPPAPNPPVSPPAYPSSYPATPVYPAPPVAPTYPPSYPAAPAYPPAYPSVPAPGPAIHRPAAPVAPPAAYPYPAPPDTTAPNAAPLNSQEPENPGAESTSPGTLGGYPPPPRTNYP